MVRDWIEPKHRELKPVLAFRLAMTPGGVATKTAQERLDVVLEIKPARLGRACYLHAHAQESVLHSYFDHGRSIRRCFYQARRRDRGDGWIDTMKTRGARAIMHVTVPGFTVDQQRQARLRALEPNARRIGHDLHVRGIAVGS